MGADPTRIILTAKCQPTWVPGPVICKRCRLPIFPSDNGLRCDVRQAVIGSVCIDRLDDDFAFAVSDFGVKSLMGAQHTFECIEQSALHVHVDGYHMGVGGDDSWTPSVRPEYLLTAETYRWSFRLSVTHDDKA